jgi:hypothetical protein
MNITSRFRTGRHKLDRQLDRRLDRHTTRMLGGARRPPPVNHLRDACKQLKQYIRGAIRLRKKYPDVFGPRAMENYLDILRMEEQRHQIDAALRKIYDVKTTP